MLELAFMPESDFADALAAEHGLPFIAARAGAAATSPAIATAEPRAKAALVIVCCELFFIITFILDGGIKAVGNSL